ncbi:MAG: hypothetical protein QM539_04505 [Alphaproteobacteria bacterium]|nr:hypothetical protein [Alphaproteobacteria bacterium]
MKNQTYAALFQLVLLIILGVFILWLTYFVILKKIKKKYQIEGSPHLSFSIIICAHLFSTGYITSGIYKAYTFTLQFLHKNSNSNLFDFYSTAFGYLVEFILIGLIISFIVNFISVKLFSLLTVQVDEMEEINNNKVQYALLLATILIVISIFAKEPFMNLLDTLVPYPKLNFID